MALNVSNGKWIWAFQTTAHDLWDYDCSWYQGLINETISGVNTQVVVKTCKNGWLYEINAVTGDLIWAWNPPASVQNAGAEPLPILLAVQPNKLQHDGRRLADGNQQLRANISSVLPHRRIATKLPTVAICHSRL